MPKTEIFYYTREQFIANQASLIETPLNPIDSTITSIVSYYSPLIQQDGIDGGNISATDFIRNITATEKNVESNISLITPKGNLNFSIVHNKSIFIPNEVFTTYATYRTGEYTSVQFPKVEIEVLDDLAATRKYTITY